MHDKLLLYPMYTLQFFRNDNHMVLLDAQHDNLELPDKCHKQN